MFFNRKKSNNTTATATTNNNKLAKTYITPGGYQVYKPFLTLAENNHLLIAGASGSGKSVLENGIITSLIMMYSPYNTQFIFCDPKRVELNSYKYLPHCVKYANNAKEIIFALKMAEVEMERRYKIMESNRQKEFCGSHLYIVIDELLDIMTTDKKSVFPMLQRLAQLGRAARVHLICCSQCILSKVIPTELKVNFTVIVGLRTATAQQSRYLISATGCECLPDPKTTGKGQGIIRDGADLFPLDIYKYPDGIVESVINYWNSGKCIA